MRSLAFFNNKGGVGKTTLACNFAHYLSTERKAKTLILDLDPQCNSTQLLLREEVWDEVYSDQETSTHMTILHPLLPISAGDSGVLGTDLPIRQSDRFQVDVLPGHPALSTLEDKFGTSWADFKAGDPGGARRSAWLRALALSLETLGYEFVVIDVGPSLGAINRSVLIGADFFLTPTAPDLFSLFALDNIAGWLDVWVADYQRLVSSAIDQLARVGHVGVLPAVLPINSGFIGYTVQQYYTTIRGGERRRIEAYDKHRRQIPARAAGLISRSTFSGGELDLGTVPNMFSMIPLAQSKHAPIAGLKKADGVLGAQVNQQTRYSGQLKVIFEKIADRLL